MRNALLVRAGALGDVLLLRPAVAALKSAGVRVVLMAPAHSGVVLLGRGPSEVDALISWDRADVAQLMADAGMLSSSLRQELGAFDLAIAYTRNQALTRNLATVVPSVIGWDPTPPAGGFHAARCFAEPLSRLGLPVDLVPPPASPTDAEQREADVIASRLPPGFVAIHPGSGSPSKNWPVPSFAALARRLAGDRGWLLVEGPADEAAVATLRREAVVAKQLPPRVLGALLSRSGNFVGNDSGVSHLAAAFGAPVVALFGPTDPKVWRPLGTRVRALRSATGRMEDLGIEEVEAACLALRSGEAGPPGC
jgi:heptosyltransferase-3